MKQQLLVTLIHDSGSQRYYKLNHKIQTAPYMFGRKNASIQEDISKGFDRWKPEYKHLCPTDGVDVICVSDARHHAERIVFAAVISDKGPSRLSTQIDGYNTMMIHGGDEAAVYPDYVYLRRIAAANGLTFHYHDFPA